MCPAHFCAKYVNCDPGTSCAKGTVLLAPTAPLSDVERGLILEQPRTSSMASPSDNPLRRLIREIHRRLAWLTDPSRRIEQ